MSLICEFTLRGLPKTINSLGRKHWAIKAREAKIWKKMVYEASVFHRIVGLHLLKVRIILIRRSSSECDFDGLVSSFKHVLDGLVEAGVIDNDKPSVIGSPTYLWEKAKKKDGSITIKIFHPLEELD